LILGERNRTQGSGTAGHPALLNAVLGTVHAGGEQGCEPLVFELSCQWHRSVAKFGSDNR